MKILPFLFFFLPFTLSAATIKIRNDSPYTLNATIYDVNDQIVGSSLINGNGHYYTWRDSSHGASDWTKGPFTVRFTCPGGAEYGRVYRVADGVTVFAKAAIGPRRCFSTSSEIPLGEENQ